MLERYRFACQRVEIAGRFVRTGGMAAMLVLTIMGAACEVVALPTLFLIGDSTVKNGRGDGSGGLWGWGQVLDEHFDTERIAVVNRALGGRSSRTYLTEGLWERVLGDLKPGDFVLIQFGHNDGGEVFSGNRPRASLKGNGDETVDGIVETTGESETVRSFGWYLRRFVADAQAKGATPIVLSPIPRNRWRDGKVIHAADDYGRWAAEAASQAGAAFIDLNAIVVERYELLGEEMVRRDYFTSADHTHTTRAGARINAACVAAGIRQLEDCPLREYLQETTEIPHSASTLPPRRFDFGAGDVAAGYTKVKPTANYSETRGYGFEPGSEVFALTRGDGEPLARDLCVSDEPFYFSVMVPPGNYRVTATFGDPAGRSPTTIKAELRRLMVDQALPLPASLSTRTFTVNVRTPDLPGVGTVRLKDREKTTEQWAWDEKLTLEFNGRRPAVAALVIEPVHDATTVYLAGDSTVSDQPLEPWNSWGQMLPRFFAPQVAVANHAQSGESIRSAWGARRFDKIFSLIRSGDYLFVQFGHNDMKDPADDALAKYGEHLGRLVVRTRELGATPVLVTSMERKDGVTQDTLEGYPQAVRDVAAKMNVPLVDLHATSKRLYRALGDNLDLAFQDGTHHTSYGSYLLAKCVVQAIRDLELQLAVHIVDDFAGFDPAQPDPFTTFTVPPSPRRDPAIRPDGR